MASAFLRTPTRLQRAGGAFWRVFSSLAFQTALLAALLGGGIAYAGLSAAAWHGRQVRVELLTARLGAVADRVATEIRDPLWLHRTQRLQEALARSLDGSLDCQILILDSTGKVAGRAGTGALTAPLDLAEILPTAGAGRIGSSESGRWFELRREVVGLERTVGEVRARAALPPAPWAAHTSAITIAVGLLLLLGVWRWQARALRPLLAFDEVFRGASREEFWRRLPISGCGEIRRLASRLNGTMESLTDASIRVEQAYIETAKSLAKTIEAKDRYTSGHSERVRRYSVELGEWAGLPEDRIAVLDLGALLHDVGKVGIADAVLGKKGVLDDEEFQEMQKHPVYGDRILRPIRSLRDVADIARSHHERWDGRGYPFGQRGEAIPLEGRIVGIADAYDAIVTKRSYKPAIPVAEALRRLEEGAGTQFDPELVRLFVAKKRGGCGYRALKPGSEVEMDAAPAESHPYIGAHVPKTPPCIPRKDG